MTSRYLSVLFLRHTKLSLLIFRFEDKHLEILSEFGVRIVFERIPRGDDRRLIVVAEEIAEVVVKLGIL